MVIKMKKIRLLLISLVILTQVNAQTTISILQEVSYYSNVFNNYKHLPDVTDFAGLSVAHLFQREQLESRLYYNGRLNMFNQYSDRFSQFHQFGYDGIFTSTSERHVLYFGLRFSDNSFQESYDYYNSRRLTLYVNSKIKFKSNIIARFGYSMKNKKYAEIPEFSYWEHILYFQGNTFFQTGSSITVYVNYGIKNYIPLTYTNGQGRERTMETYELPAVDQLILSIKLAQSLGLKTSLSAKYLNQFNPGLAAGVAAVMNVEEMFTENEVFDDRYGYQGHEFDITLTHFLPFFVKLQTSAVYIWKNYHYRQIYDLSGMPILSEASRQDRRMILWTRLSRGLGSFWSLKNLELYVEGGFVKNQSNDPYYQFNNGFGSFGLNLRVR
jgi:hypothetical protein